MVKSLSVLLLLVATTVAARPSTVEFEWLGERIFNNETGGKIERLVYWNENEEFPSLGIGHFIWIPKGITTPFDPSFPPMVEFVTKQTNLAPPAWVKATHPPWANREAFQRDLESPAMNTLRRWLEETWFAQAEFIVHRFDTRSQLILASVLDEQNAAMSDPKSEAIARRYQKLMQTRYGQFALIDYNNFKGFGHLPEERYNGVGWGVLQVLEAMIEPVGSAAVPDVCWVQSFSEAAGEVLQHRVQASPPERNEVRWIPGWKNRLATYWQEIPVEERRDCISPLKTQPQ